MLAMYKKDIFLVVFVWFAWLLSKYKNSFFMLLLSFTLLILDLSLEAAIREAAIRLTYLLIRGVL